MVEGTIEGTYHHPDDGNEPYITQSMLGTIHVFDNNYEVKILR
jgi:hypothetical protein